MGSSAYSSTSVNNDSRPDRWRQVNNWLFVGVLSVIGVAGFYASIRLLATSGFSSWVVNFAQLSMWGLAVGSLVTAVRIARGKFARWWWPLVGGALFFFWFLGYVMLATPPFTKWFYWALLAVLASVVCQFVRDVFSGFRFGRGA